MLVRMPCDRIFAQRPPHAFDRRSRVGAHAASFASIGS